MSYWDYNLPLQVWDYDGDVEILNYMPRRETCERCDLQEVLEGTGQTYEEFFEQAAQTLEMLAQRMRELAARKHKNVYYPNHPVPDDNEE